MSLARIASLLFLSLTLSGSAFGQSGAGASPPWVQLAKLSSSSLYAYGNGNPVAISGDVVVVGAPYGQFASVYVMPQPGWANMVETATLTASDEPVWGNFGNSVAILGNTIVVGDPAANAGRTGAVYVFVKPSGGWTGTLTQTAKLTASDTATGDELGYSVAISDGTIVSGAPYQLNETGAVYEFTKPAGGWVDSTETAKLTASDGQPPQGLGISVSASAGVIVAGSPFATIGSNLGQGAVYVYVEPTSGWTNATQTAKLTASDGQQYDDLGYSVSLSGQVLAAGAPGPNFGSSTGPGAAYVFVEPAGGWVSRTQTAKLTAAGGYAGDYFGTSVATDGNAVVSGAPRYSHSANQLTSKFFNEGAAYVFVKPTSGWSNENQAAKLTGSDARFGTLLGTSAAITGNTVVAGCLFNNLNPGAAYIFSTFSGQ